MLSKFEAVFLPRGNWAISELCQRSAEHKCKEVRRDVGLHNTQWTHTLLD